MSNLDVMNMKVVNSTKMWLPQPAVFYMGQARVTSIFAVSMKTTGLTQNLKLDFLVEGVM